MSRWICFSLLVVICSGCGRSTGPKSSGTSPTSTEIAAEAATIDASVLLQGADLIVPLKDLETKDKFALAEHFGRKTVQTTGTIDDISYDSPTTSRVTFKQEGLFRLVAVQGP